MLTYPLVSPIEEINGIWNFFFGGAYSKEGVGADIMLISPTQKEIYLSYKLDFEATNNVAEYEALILRGIKKYANHQIGGIWRFKISGIASKRFLSNKASKNEGVHK
jgi:ribonuclease HI